MCADIRFLSKVTTTETCWVWNGSINTFGYGQITGPAPAKQIMLAHIYAWTRCGYLHDNSTVLRHSCDNRRCVRPDHLEIGTPQDNVNDTWERGRMNPRGRALNEDLVRGIRRARQQDGTSYQELAAQYGVTFTTIARVCTGRTWKEVV